MKKINILILIIIVLFTSCKKEQESTQNTEQNFLNTAIESYLKDQKKIHEIPGFALAVIKNNKTIYKGYFGVENIETNKKVDASTIFPVFSVTKLIAATTIFKLIEEGKLTLEDTIGQYIDDLPLTWQSVTIANLLTHSSGLPDFFSNNKELTDNDMFSLIKQKELLFTQGNEWKYTQTNYWFLAKIIHKVTSVPFDSYVLNTQFENAKNPVFFSMDFKNRVENRVLEYMYNNETNQQEADEVLFKGKRGDAAGGLNISLDDFILWNQNFDKNSIINPTTKEKMWQPFKYNNPEDEFLHGWGLYNLNNTDSYGFTGGLKTGFRKFIKNDMTIIFLSNGFKYYPTHNIIIDHIAGMVDENLLDKGSLINEKLSNTFLKETTEKAILEFKKIKTANPNTNLESALNRIGYVFLRSNSLEKAITVFKLNTQEYPTSGNVFDSLGEAYFVSEMYKLSKENYKKSLVLDPKNENAKMMLEKIEKLTTKN